MTGATPRPLASRAAEGAGRAGGPTRRRVVLGAVGAVASMSALTGCGWRLDLPQPPPPVPTRRPAPDEQFVIGVLAELRALVAAAGTVSPDESRRSALRATVTVLERQVVVLTGRLTNAGVPSSVITVAPAAPSTPTVSPSTTVAASEVDGFADVLASFAPARWQSLAATSADTRDLVLAAWSARLACAVRLGASVEPSSAPSRARAAIATHTSPLVYAFEVVAAQSSGRRRSTAAHTLSQLRGLDLAVSGGGAATPGGWSLPFPVTAAAAAQRLGDTVLAAAVDAVVDVAGPAPDAAALEDAARWSARVQSIATGWGMPPTPFPGART
ncbi:MAG: hypothetical protein ABI336_13840 [Humibacillus sp.]